jgi:hypothetical protein
MTVATLGLFALATLIVLLGGFYFRRYRVSRPPLGVMTLGDVVVLIAGIVVIPYVYLFLPGWLVGGILALGTLGIVQLLLEPLLPRPWLSWLLALLLVAADILFAWRTGPESLGYFVVNNLVIVLVVVGVTNLWAQSGLRARDLALLGAALTLYDLIATAILPLTDELIARLAGLPFTPLLIWPVGAGLWMGIGLGDLLLATVGPLVFRKAYGRPAGLAALVIALTAIGAVFLLPLTGLLRGTFPVMVVLGPLLVAQYAFWQQRLGRERTTAEYLAREPLAAGDPEPATAL